MKTSAAPARRKASRQADPELEHDRWQALCTSYLPIDEEKTNWRYSRPSRESDADQGWKLHVSATILSANQVFERVAPYLKRKGVLFKAPCSLRELEKLNSGLHYGYSQIGKFITVYPSSPKEAVFLARQLHRFTRSIHGPAVPFDSRFRRDSCVYYRYGAFKCVEIEDQDGALVPAVRDHLGTLVPDLRYAESAKPHWVDDPFVDKKSRREDASNESPLKTTFRVFQSLAQRGKGGVYKAFDFSVNPPRLCLLKEGRDGGEVAWDGRDGRWLVRHEEEVLASLRKAGVDVPEIYSSFEVNGNHYLVTEFIEGPSLHDFLSSRQRRLSLSVALDYAIKLSVLVSRIHAAGWVWRDCKPANIIIAGDGRLRPVDFEGSCSINRPDPMWWSTPAFTALESLDRNADFSGKYHDLYALGAVTYFLFTGRLPEGRDPVPVERLRKKMPRDVCDLVAKSLDADPKRRPEAAEVLRRLRAATR